MKQRAREAVALAEALGDVDLAALAGDVLFDICRVRGTAPPAAFAALLGAGRSRQLRGEVSPVVLLAEERCHAGEGSWDKVEHKD